MKNTYEIYPGLALVRLRTTGPWMTEWGHVYDRWSNQES